MPGHRAATVELPGSPQEISQLPRLLKKKNQIINKARRLEKSGGVTMTVVSIPDQKENLPCFRVQETKF